MTDKLIVYIERDYKKVYRRKGELKNEQNF